MTVHRPPHLLEYLRVAPREECLAPLPGFYLTRRRVEASFDHQRENLPF